ncbi:MAG: hypothetical protein HYY80_02820, partial [Chloroflexi bacterium]|nr:hypothetical protein [Chloroflexota bacterium]
TYAHSDSNSYARTYAHSDSNSYARTYTYAYTTTGAGARAKTDPYSGANYPNTGP